MSSIRVAATEVAGTDLPAAAARVAEEVVAERLRQLNRGFSAADDDRFVAGELARAAAARALWAADAAAGQGGALARLAAGAHPQPWKSPAAGTAGRRLLVEAAALLLAEIERIDRAAAAETTP